MPDTEWPSRFASNEIKWAEPTDLLANPSNARRHPADQREAIIESLDTLGWVAPMIVNVTTNRLLDGHARTEEAITKGVALVPFVEVALEEDEERRVLATLDPISALAVWDAEVAADLFAAFTDDQTATAAMLADLVTTWAPPIDGPDYGNTRMGLTPGERGESHDARGLRTIILVYPDGEYEDRLEQFAEARKALDVESNAEVVTALLADLTA